MEASGAFSGVPIEEYILVGHQSCNRVNFLAERYHPKRKEEEGGAEKVPGSSFDAIRFRAARSPVKVSSWWFQAKQLVPSTSSFRMEASFTKASMVSGPASLTHGRRKPRVEIKFRSTFSVLASFRRNLGNFSERSFI